MCFENVSVGCLKTENSYKRGFNFFIIFIFLSTCNVSVLRVLPERDSSDSVSKDIVL